MSGVVKIRLVGPVAAMTAEDFAATSGPAFRPQLAVDKLKDSHHRIARLKASGLRPFEIAERTGYSQNRIQVLLSSPAMLNLIDRYRTKVDAAFERSQDSYYELATKNMVTAERMIADKLEVAEDDLDSISIKDLALISRDAADRFGYGKKQTNVNINADFASELEKAIARSGKTIELHSEGGQVRRRA